MPSNDATVTCRWAKLQTSFNCWSKNWFTSSYYFSTKLLPKHYQLVRLEVEKEISCATYITITSDLWTAQHQHRTYISLTVHFVDASFQMRSRCLQTPEILQDHSADSISEVLSEMLIDWKIKERVIGATTDNAKNITNAIEQMDIQHLPCVGHTLQRGLKIAKVKSCISQCKSVVSHFKKSTKDTHSLRDKQANAAVTTSWTHSRLCDTVGKQH